MGGVDVLMRFHVPALPHTRTSKEFCGCAYTIKTLHFCKMLRSLGHEVIHYGAEDSRADCTEHVNVISRSEQERFFPSEWSPNVLAWDSTQPYWNIFNLRTAAEIMSRKQPRDFLCIIGGACQKPIVEMVGGDVLAVEYGVGYYGTFARYRVFESYTHQAAVYGMASRDPDGALYDAVIPNSFDPADFPAGNGGDYLLYIGRVTSRKGVQIAIDTAKAAGIPLVIAGPMGDFGALPDWVEYLGPVGVERRAALMGSARAVLVPTLYMEPFGGVAVEAQMCGTPVVSTDHAAFSETVRHGITGFRCHTLAQFVEAVDQAGALDRARIRSIATENYSIDRVRFMYETYFRMLEGLWSAGWSDLGRTGTSDLKWLTRAGS